MTPGLPRYTCAVNCRLRRSPLRDEGERKAPGDGHRFPNRHEARLGERRGAGRPPRPGAASGSPRPYPDTALFVRFSGRPEFFRADPLLPADGARPADDGSAPGTGRHPDGPDQCWSGPARRPAGRPLRIPLAAGRRPAGHRCWPARHRSGPDVPGATGLGRGDGVRGRAGLLPAICHCRDLLQRPCPAASNCVDDWSA